MDDALELLVAQAEAHPRTTMLLAQQCFIAVLETGTAQTLREHAVVAFDMATKADSAAIFKDIESIRDLSHLCLAVSQAIARGTAPYKIGPAHAVARAVQARHRAGYIEQLGTPGRGDWVVIEPLLRQRLAQMP